MKHFQKLIFFDIAVGENRQIEIGINTCKPADERAKFSKMKDQLFLRNFVHSTELVESILNELNLTIKSLLYLSIVMIKTVLSHFYQSFVDLNFIFSASNLIDTQSLVNLNC